MPNSQRSVHIGILGTMDTRGDEVAFLKRTIKERGHRAIAIDLGVLGTPYEAGDINREKVATAGGTTLRELQLAAAAGADRSDATRVMIAGAKQLVAALVKNKDIDAVLGLGGTTAAASYSEIVRALPFGFPKLLVTTFARLAPIGNSDITVMQSPVDLIGMNRVVESVLAQAALAIIGMAQVDTDTSGSKPLVGITALGVTTPAVQKLILRLTQDGFDSVVFHATTTRLNQMIEAGLIDAVIDLTTNECVALATSSNQQLERSSADAAVTGDRLPALRSASIPWVVAPGGLDMHIVVTPNGIDGIPYPLQGRVSSQHGPNIVLVRTNEADMRAVAALLGSHVMLAPKSTVVIPLLGFSAIDAVGGAFYMPDTDREFIDRLKSAVAPRSVVEVHSHINDDDFADAIVAELKKLM
jgi:uncharacterized protein (UPF0261 family)